MNRRILILALALAAATTTTACGSKKPKVQDTVDSQPTSEPEPPKPPPPKCEKLEEKCESKGGKKAKIPGSLLVFEPTNGWTYAQQEKITVAQLADEDACQGLVGHEVADAKKVDAARQTALELLAAELKLTLPKTKVQWKSGEKYEQSKVPQLRWTLEKVVRGAKKGDLLIVGTQPNDGKAVLGVAFVPSDDDKSIEKVLKSFDTIGAGEAP